jgi:STE24 endopeptidase
MRGSSALRLGATAIAAVIVAEGAVWLLRPREIVEGTPVSEHAYFSERQLERARDYRSGQRWLLIGTLAVEGGLLVALASGRPAVARRALERLGERPLRGAALAGAGLSLGLALATAPFGVAAHERAVDVGLSTQDIGGWLSDWTKSAAIGATLTAGAATLAIALIRRYPRRWWIAATAAVVAFEVLFVYVAPVLLAPIFNKFTPLPEGKVRSDVLELGRRAGVDIGEVYRVDESRRSTSLNAYVNGIGPTKRVVLYDNLIESVPESELRSVVAHELGHVKGRDVPRGMLWVAIAAPLTLLFAAGAFETIAKRRGVEPGSPAALPALALVMGLTVFVVGVAGNQLSRSVERRADTFALELTNDPEALIAVQRQLSVRNLGDPDPPWLVRVLFDTHPSTVERIGAAKAWEAGERP